MRTKNKKSRQTRKLHKSFLVVTDGVVTERGYFEKVKKLTHDSINVVARCSEDIGALVKRAVEMKNNSDYDVAAVVCDVDQRLQNKKSIIALKNALQLAGGNGVLVCLSHESFEVWLLAHLGRVKSGAGSRSKAHELAIKNKIVKGRDGKEIVTEKITKESILVALEESQRLRKAYGEDILASSPTTDVDKLVFQIEFD